MLHHATFLPKVVSVSRKMRYFACELKEYRVMVVNRNEITPELAAEREKARQEYRGGKCITLKTHEDIEKWFESL